MSYFSRLYLDLLEAYAGFLRSRYTTKVAYYRGAISPLEERIAALRSKLAIEASHGVVFDGQKFSNQLEPSAAAEPVVEKAPEVIPEESSADSDSEAAEAITPVYEAPEASKKEPTEADSEIKVEPVSLDFHPELTGEVVVFTDSDVELLNNLEQEFHPGLLESTEIAMKTLDRTRIIVSAKDLNVHDHIGMFVTPILDDSADQGNFPQAYFVMAHQLPEEMSIQVSHGKHRDMVRVMVVHAETHGIMALMTPADNKWMLESRRP